MVTPTDRRRAVGAVRQNHQVSERRACQALGVNRSLIQYEPVPKDDGELLQALSRLATQAPGAGYKRLTELLRQEGRVVNHKRVYRIYRQANLAVTRGGLRLSNPAPPNARD
jgi:putative transposase